MKSQRAFSPIEILVVIGIIMILMAIVLSVMSQVKSKAHETDDVARMKQLYEAVVMYENDHDEVSPLSLLYVGAYVSTKALFQSNSDPYLRSRASDFPADLYVGRSPRRSSFRISYAYLRPFEWIWLDPTSALGLRGVTWTTLRETPDIGMLADAWFLGRSTKNSVRDENGPSLGAGMMVRIQMDGSLRLIFKRVDGPDPSVEDLFFNSDQGAPFVE